MKYMGRTLVLAYTGWFLFITAAIDNLHGHHGPFDDNPKLDWIESRLCLAYWSRQARHSTIEAAHDGQAPSMHYCPASTYLAVSTAESLDAPENLSFAYISLGTSDPEETTVPAALLGQLPTSRGPPTA